MICVCDEGEINFIFFQPTPQKPFRNKKSPQKKKFPPKFFLYIFIKKKLSYLL